MLIVTNAHQSWVQYSSQTLMPQTAKLLNNQIKVISARVEPGTSAAVLPPSQWKIKKFMQLHNLLEINPEQIMNLIVVGDSMNEMNAGQRLSKSLPHCILKMIKMQEQPQPKELIKQLLVISDSWESISDSARNFNMKLERKQKRKNGDVSSPN